LRAIPAPSEGMNRILPMSIERKTLPKPEVRPRNLFPSVSSVSPW
jgi:hypothetical protein